MQVNTINWATNKAYTCAEALEQKHPSEIFGF